MSRICLFCNAYLALSYIYYCIILPPPLPYPLLLSQGLKCDDLSLAVPCPDGQCHSDYISCLRSLSYQAHVLAEQYKEQEQGRQGGGADGAVQVSVHSVCVQCAMLCCAML
jgi:hypothetical protein